MSQEAQVKKTSASTSLATTLATTFVLLSVLSLLGIGSYQIYHDFQTQQNLVLSNQRLEASRAADQVVSFIEQIFETLDASARVGRLDAVPTEERRLWLNNLLDAHSALRTLSFVDEKGDELARVSHSSLVAPSQLISYVDTELFAQTREGRHFIGTIFPDETTGEPLVMLAIPVTNIYDDFEGILVAEVNLKFMWEVIDNLQIGQNGLAYVVDRQGKLIAFRDHERVLENVSHLFEVTEFLNENEENEEEKETAPELATGITGENVLSTYVPLREPDWAVFIELPAWEAYQNLIQTVAVSLGMLFFVATLSGIAGIYASRRLAAPLLNLTKTATRIAEGELDLEVQPEGPTETVRLADAFNSMTRQLRDLIDSLEQRITARTQRLETVAILSERLTAILNVDELLAEMVNQIKGTFGYYHAHVYLLDEAGENLMVAHGTGPAGAEMKAAGHYIPLDAFHSLVARAAREGKIVKVDNVRESPDWLPNSLLPDTYSEMAVPIVLEGKVVGVLDVQESRVAGLDEGDANLLRSLVNQVAIAMRNARLFNQVETALAEAYAAQERYVQQSWGKTKIVAQEGHYLYTGPKATPLDEAKQQAMAKVREQVFDQATLQTLPGVSDTGEGQTLAAPVRLGNTIIGNFQLYRNGSDRVWTEDELAVVETVMEQLAQSAENLRLFTEARQRASQEQVIREITDKLRTAPNLDFLLETAARELSRHLGVPQAVIELGVETDLYQTATMPAGQNGH